MIKIVHSRKSIIFTLDATLAVLLGLVLIFSSLTLISRSQVSFTSAQEQKFAFDTLAILEKTSLLDSTIQTQSSTALQSYIDTSSQNHCLKIELFNSTNTRILTLMKLHCEQSEDYIIARRVFISNQQPYLARLEVWQG